MARDEEEAIDAGPHEEGSAMGFLHEMQQAFLRMIGGIGRFLLQTLPSWFYSLFQNVLRVVGKAIVVFALAAVWALIVFGPATFAYLADALGNVYIAVPVGIWAVIALTGSFRTLAKLRSQNGGVGCVWAVGVSLAIVACGLLVYAHFQTLDSQKESVPTKPTKR
jgi:hypothetical protein